MPIASDIERRDRAVFAFFMLTGIRDGAAAFLRLKHVNLEEGHVFQDGRDVRTKNGKTINTWFYPVDPVYRECFEEWVRYLRVEELFGDADALFPKPKVVNRNGAFTVAGLSRDTYANASKLNEAIRTAFAAVQLPEYTPHSFRKTLALLANEVCTTLEQYKAWSLNLGHDRLGLHAG